MTGKSAPTPLHLLYLVYGDGPCIDETIFSILSARALGDAGAYGVVVYTDRPERFRALDVTVDTVDARLLGEWAGPLGFSHRRKIFAMKKSLRQFGGRVALCDSDTYFVAHPRRLFGRIGPSRSVMHVCEGHLNSQNGEGLAEFLDRAELCTLSGRPWNITRAALMFNAGVVGLDEADGGLLDEVLHLTDEMYPAVRIHTIEQFAFSACLAARTSLRESNDVVAHYWPGDGRALFQAELRRALHDATRDQHEEVFRRLWARRPIVRPTRFGRLGRLRSRVGDDGKQALRAVRRMVERLAPSST